MLCVPVTILMTLFGMTFAMNMDSMSLLKPIRRAMVLAMVMMQYRVLHSLLSR